MGFKPDVDSIGKASEEYYKNFFELCCGTHVSNSKHLKKMVISSISKIKPDVYRIVAICGDLAIESETKLAEFKSQASNVSKLAEKTADAPLDRLIEYQAEINSLTSRIQSTTLVIGSKKALLDTIELSKSIISKIKEVLMKEKINAYISTLETEIEASLEQSLFSKIIESDDFDKKSLSNIVSALTKKYPTLNVMLLVIDKTKAGADELSVMLDLKINNLKLLKHDAKFVDEVWKKHKGIGGGSKLVFKGSHMDPHTSLAAFNEIKTFL